MRTTLLGADMAKRLERGSKGCQCHFAHHNDTEPQTIEAVIVQIADAISAARPGARRETLDTHQAS